MPHTRAWKEPAEFADQQSRQRRFPTTIGTKKNDVETGWAQPPTRGSPGLRDPKPGREGGPPQCGSYQEFTPQAGDTHPHWLPVAGLERRDQYGRALLTPPPTNLRLAFLPVFFVQRGQRLDGAIVDFALYDLLHQVIGEFHLIRSYPEVLEASSILE